MPGIMDSGAGSSRPLVDPPLPIVGRACFADGAPAPFRDEGAGSEKTVRAVPVLELQDTLSICTCETGSRLFLRTNLRAELQCASGFVVEFPEVAAAESGMYGWPGVKTLCKPRASHT